MQQFERSRHLRSDRGAYAAPTWDTAAADANMMSSSPASPEHPRRHDGAILLYETGFHGHSIRGTDCHHAVKPPDHHLEHRRHADAHKQLFVALVVGSDGRQHPLLRRPRRGGGRRADRARLDFGRSRSPR